MTKTEARRKAALLRAKAESTTFPAEAEALVAKAEQLESAYQLAPASRKPSAVGTVSPDWPTNVRKTKVMRTSW